MSLIHVFVSLCRQIGIQAYPINFPGTIIAYVPTGSDSPPLIVNLWTGNAENAVMNNRPEWQSDAAFPFPVFPGPNDAILRPCTNPVPMLKRSSYNILNSIQVDPTIDSHDRQAAIMAVLYVGLVLTDDTFVYRNLSNLPLVDCLILYRNLLPKLNDEHQAAFNEHCVKAIQQEESKIAALDAPKRRASSSRPKYFVGMAMNHLKYNYRGVIFGWTVSGRLHRVGK
jgi:F-box protein 21